MTLDNQMPDALAELRREAEKVAGPVVSLRTRAAAYLQLYADSNGACVFALIAAQGAIWASWYLVCAKLAAMVFATVDLSPVYGPKRRYKCFAAYVMSLKEINRSVMIETYILVHGIRRFGCDVMRGSEIPFDLIEDYERAMTEPCDPAFLRDIYHRHFLWEQERVVSDTLDRAFDAFDWRFMASLCQRPWVWFAYFRVGRSMNFRQFTDQAERVEKGLVAFDRAFEQGLLAIQGKTKRQIKGFERILGAPRV
ncbi:MAG: hypothetical protein ABJD89_00290 [Paracoccaceae bacterium]